MENNNEHTTNGAAVTTSPYEGDRREFDSCLVSYFWDIKKSYVFYPSFFSPSPPVGIA